MRFSKVALIIVLAVWIATLVASYQIGSRRERLRQLAKSENGDIMSAQQSGNIRNQTEVSGPTEGKSAKTGKSEKPTPQSIEGKPLEGNLAATNQASEKRKNRQQSVTQQSVTQQSEEEIIARLYDQLINLPEGNQKRNLFFSYISRLAKSDPVAAMEFASQWENYNDRESGIVKVLTNWGKQDAESAWNWILQNNENPQLIYNRIQSVLKGAAIKDPDLAFSLAMDIEDANMQANAIGQLARTLLRSNKYDAIVNQLGNLPEGKSRDRFVSQIAYDWGQKDPQATAEWINGLENSSEQRKATLRLSDAWSRRNPPEAADWALSLNNEKIRQQSLQRVINSWMHYDIGATANWLNQHPPSADLDLAVSVFVNRVMNDDPEGARSWAESITNPNLRKETLKRIDRATNPEG